MSYLDPVEPELSRKALMVARTLRAAGHEALFAGGAVRNLLLERPVADIDIATSATPDQVEALFTHTIPVGRQFGVVLVVLDGVPFEVATFREESGYQDGRHPGAVRFSDARRDALRRDFTINALFLDPETQELYDFVGGRADLEAGLIRAVGDPADRFDEDKLRLMRAVRFSAELGFRIDEATYREICLRSGEIGVVSQERIGVELLKILTGSDPAEGLRLLHRTGLLTVILPEVEAMVGVDQPPQFHPEGDVFVHTCLMFEHADRPGPALALGILLHDVGKPPTFRIEERIRFDGHAEVGADMAEVICRRLRLARELSDRVVELVRHHLRFMHVRAMKESTLKRFLRIAHFEDHLELHRLDCISSHRDLSNYEFCRSQLALLGQEAIRPVPLLRGKDLIQMGFKPGPVFSQILGQLEDLQLEGSINSKELAIEWLHRNWGPTSGE